MLGVPGESEKGWILVDLSAKRGLWVGNIYISSKIMYIIMLLRGQQYKEKYGKVFVSMIVEWDEVGNVEQMW